MLGMIRRTPSLDQQSLPRTTIALVVLVEVSRRKQREMPVLDSPNRFLAAQIAERLQC